MKAVSAGTCTCANHLRNHIRCGIFCTISVVWKDLCIYLALYTALPLPSASVPFSQYHAVYQYITFVSEKVVRGSIAGGVWDLHTYSVTSISWYTLKGMASSFRYNGVGTIMTGPLFTRHAIMQGQQCTIVANDTMPDSCIRSEGGDSIRDLWGEICYALC